MKAFSRYTQFFNGNIYGDVNFDPNTFEFKVLDDESYLLTKPIVPEEGFAFDITIRNTTAVAQSYTILSMSGIDISKSSNDIVVTLNGNSTTTSLLDNRYLSFKITYLNGVVTVKYGVNSPTNTVATETMTLSGGRIKLLEGAEGVDLINAYSVAPSYAWVAQGYVYKDIIEDTVRHYWKNNYTINATKVGSPTVNNCVASGFSNSNYFSTPSITLGNSFEIYIKFTYVTDSNGYNTLFRASKRLSLVFHKKSSSNIVIHFNTGNGSSWNTGTDGTTQLVNNTTYFVKAIGSNGVVTVYLSTDNENWTTELTHSFTTFPTLTYTLGSADDATSQYFNGSIDFNECYVKANESIVWNGTVVSSRTEVTSTDPYDYYTDENIYKELGQNILLDTSTPGTYTVTLAAGDYEVVCVGAGGPAAMRGVYDDKGYGWGGGSGGAFKGVFTLTAGSYTVVVGSANNNTTAQSGNTQTLNPSDTTTHDSSIDGVVICGGGGAGHYNTDYVGAAGAAPVLSLVPVSTVLNTAGNAGSYNSGGKGSAAAATCAGGDSVYAGYGRGQGCKTSEYASKRSWINGTNGYVKIRSV